ncbi:hypothetical protein [Fenollaria timonensis]|uniref:hypothetical protein n=1 Tax=Fenollaria timonensis TaxID=1723384 RepID=UPI0026F17B98|nr:hypothetical protein [Fenollaria timonensis]
MIDNVIVSVTTLLSTVVGAFLSHFLQNKIERRKLLEERAKERREILLGVYKQLLKIINYYPNEAPVDLLRYIEYPPYYAGENFKVIRNTLVYQIEDYKKDERKNIVEISNREYCIKELDSIEREYFEAKKMYQNFSKNDKVIFDLYASVGVRNALVDLEVLINNAFIAGRFGFKDENGVDRKEELVRKLTYEMRLDLETIKK